MMTDTKQKRKYRGHVTFKREVTVEFESDAGSYRDLQTDALESAIEQELIDLKTDRVEYPWIEEVR